MFRRNFRILTLLSLTIPLVGCEQSVWDKPPNVTGSAVVAQIERDTRYSKAFGNLSTIYVVKVRESDIPTLREVKVPGSKIEDSDMVPTIGKRAAIKCYREDPDSSCYASSYYFEGRELVVRSK